MFEEIRLYRCDLMFSCFTQGKDQVGTFLSEMDECQLKEIQRICGTIHFGDISLSRVKESVPTSLAKIKKNIDKVSHAELSLIFGRDLANARQSIGQVVSYLYKKERDLFDLIYDLLESLPPSSEITTVVDHASPLLRVIDSWSVNLEAGQNAFTFRTEGAGKRYCLEFASHVCATVSIGDSTLFESVSLSIPIEITWHLSSTNNFSVTVDKPVILHIMSVNRIPDNEIEADIFQRPYLAGGASDICSITHKPMAIPVRGVNCDHTSNFDLLSYVNLCDGNGCWKCPVCNRDLPYDGLAVDVDVYEIIRAKLLEDTKDLQ